MIYKIELSQKIHSFVPDAGHYSMDDDGHGTFMKNFDPSRKIWTNAPTFSFPASLFLNYFYASSKLNDFEGSIDASLMNFAVSANALCMINNLDLPLHKRYDLSYVCRKNIYQGHKLIFIYENIDRGIDFVNSSFYIMDAISKEILHENVAICSLDEYSYLNRSKGKGGRIWSLRTRRLIFKTNIEKVYDLFPLYYHSRELFSTEKFKEKYDQLSLTGIDFIPDSRFQ